MPERWDRDTRPHLRRGVTLLPADEGRWQIRADFDTVSFLDGPACDAIFPWLAPRLNGRFSIAELLAAPDCPCTEQQLFEVLHGLQSASCLVDAADSELTDALTGLGVDPATVLERLQATRVVICGRSSLAELILQVARKYALVVETATTPEVFERSSINGPCFHVVIEHDWPRDRIEMLNTRALADRRPWMLVGAWNQRVLVGPIFVPGETACYLCYRRRLDSHRQHPAAYAAFEQWCRTQDAPLDPPATLPAIASLAAAWASQELFAYLSQAQPVRTRGSVLVYYPEEVRLEVEHVLRIPWCPACTAP